jgi:hypothetical protein
MLMRIGSFTPDAVNLDNSLRTQHAANRRQSAAAFLVAWMMSPTKSVRYRRRRGIHHDPGVSLPERAPMPKMT